MEMIIFAVPPVVTAIMFVAKKLAGFSRFANGASARPFLRFTLVLFSLIGIASTSIITGEPINADSVTSLAKIALETAVSAYGSHWLYLLIHWFTNRPIRARKALFVRDTPLNHRPVTL